MNSLDVRIDELLVRAPYSYRSEEHASSMLELLRERVLQAAAASATYSNYVSHWPIPVSHARSVAELPYLPESVFKQSPPLALIPAEQFQRVLLSSATTGQQPSRIALDSLTAKRMTKGVVNILRDFIGPERRPYLVVDEPATNAAGDELAARGAAIRGLSPFASATTYCLKRSSVGELAIDEDSLAAFARRHSNEAVLIYGFTTMLWTQLVRQLAQKRICLGLWHAHVLHSGGWKKLTAEAVTRDEFNFKTAEVVGCAPSRVIDFYGMVENLGIIYPDCSEGNKHVPVTGEVIVRNALTLKPVKTGEVGLVQVCSVLPSSFPGHLLLTEDTAQVIAKHGCRCGRSGLAFRFAGRVAKAEARGCGNVEARRLEQFAEAS